MPMLLTSCLCAASAEVIKATAVPKTVRIVITSKLVNGDRFSSGVEESMAPVLKEVRASVACSQSMPSAGATLYAAT